MKFYNQLLTRCLEITQSDPSEMKVLVSEKFQYPSLGSDEHGKVLRIPKPIRKKEGYLFHGIIFPNNELGNTFLMKTLLSSVEHLSVHSVISDFSNYDVWIKDKDPKLAAFVIDLIEDLCVKVHLKTKLKGLLHDIALANAVSYSLITTGKRIRSIQSLIQSAILSYCIAGRYRYLLPRGVKKDVLMILALLSELEKFFLRRQIKLSNKWWAEDDVKQMKLKSGDKIYRHLAKFGSPREVVHLPYTDAREKAERVNEELTLTIAESFDAVANTFKTLGLELSNDKSLPEILHDAYNQEASNMLSDLAIEERWKDRLLEHYMVMGKNTEFDGIEFPHEDYAKYVRSYNKYAAAIKKITDEVRMLKNDLDTKTHQEIGRLDIQEVIQEIASHKIQGGVFIRDEYQEITSVGMEDVIQEIANRKQSRNVWIRDEYLKKNEAWGILLDLSSSLKPFSTTAREVALCLAEIAKEGITDNQCWGLYGFSNKFIIVKDIGEDYTANVKARIGGLYESGLSYTPDAIQLTSQIVASAGRDYNFLFVISDGLPSGYRDIESKLEKTIKSVQSQGITLISIGIGSNALQRYTRGPFIRADSTYDLIRKFTKMYFAISKV